MAEPVVFTHSLSWHREDLGGDPRADYSAERGGHVLLGPDGVEVGVFHVSALDEEVEKRWPTPPEVLAAAKAYDEGRANAFLVDDWLLDGEPGGGSAPEHVKAHWAREESDEHYAAGVRDERASAVDAEHERSWLYAKMQEL